MTIIQDEEGYIDPSSLPVNERMDLRYVPLSSLRRAARNPNSMGEPEYLRLKQSIAECGFVQPLVVVVHPDEPGVWELVDGHHRLDALEALKASAAPVVVASDWDEAQTLIMRIGMNKNRGELDLTLVAEDVAFLHDTLGVDMSALVLTGYDEGEINAMLASMHEDINDPQPSDMTTVSVDTGATDTGGVNPRPFMLEIQFATKDERKAAREALKKAGGGDITRGLLTLAGIEED